MEAETLKEYETSLIQFLETEFEKELLKASFKNLLDMDNKLRFTGFSIGVRELSRNILVRLSPDEKVLKCKWYKNEIKDKPNGITRGQRVIYAVQGGLNDTFVSKELGLDLVRLNKSVKEAIETLNKYVHVNEKTIGLSESEIDKYVKIIIEAFVKLFLTIKECRENLISRLEDSIDKELIDHSVSEIIDKIDILATHYWVEHISSEKHKVIEINNSHILIETNGIIEVKLQYGSGGDMKRGDGLQTYDSFPFHCQLSCKVNNIHLFDTKIETLEVDTESWYE